MVLTNEEGGLGGMGQFFAQSWELALYITHRIIERKYLPGRPHLCGGLDQTWFDILYVFVFIYLCVSLCQ